MPDEELHRVLELFGRNRRMRAGLDVQALVA
jgi:hypothetical protein